MTQLPTISLHGLSKRYGSHIAVDDLTVEVSAGVVAGFVGPNGAGKTYGDASALAKLLREEPESQVLRTFSLARTSSRASWS